MTFLKFLSLSLLSVLGNQYLVAHVYTIDPIFQVGTLQ